MKTMFLRSVVAALLKKEYETQGRLIPELKISVN